MNMNNNRIRLSESQLRQVIKESVKKVLNELSSDTVRNTIDKMNRMGATERAGHIGDLAVNNYGGKDLANDGYTMGVSNGKLQMGKRENGKVRGRLTGSETEDMKYDEELDNYNNMNPMKKMFTKKPQMPKDYGKPSWVETGRKIFTPGGPKTDNQRIAHQAANLQRWSGNKNASSTAFRK